MSHIDDTLTQKANRKFISNAMKQPLLSLKNEKNHHEVYFKLVKELFNAAPNQVILALTMEVSQKILEGNHYQAVKTCKKLINFEAELLANVPG